MKVCRWVARAAQARDAHPRVPILEPLVWPVEDLKMSVQFGKELEALASFAQFQRLAEQAVVLGKQRGRWWKRARSVVGVSPGSGGTSA